MMRSTMAFGLLLGLLWQGASASQLYLVEGELWIDGVESGTPRMLVEAHTEASLTVGNELGAWRLEIEVEPVEDRFAPSGVLWVHVAVHQRHGDRWEHLVDSIVGVPEGEFATVSVVDGDAAATPETAAVFLRIRTSRAESSSDQMRR